MKRLLTIVAALWLPIGGMSAQEGDDADRLLAAGDTSGALEVLEAMVRRRGREAELRYRVGLVYLARVEPGAAVSTDRQRAETHLRLAARLDPDSAKYVFALALVLRTQTDAMVRVQVTGLLDRALRLARRHPTPLRGEIAYRAARAAWERYEQVANRHRLVDGSSGIDHDAFLNDWDYVQDLFRRRLRGEFAGVVEWREAVRYLKEALAADPAHVAAAGLYVVALGEHDQWDTARTVAERVAAASPDDATGRGLLGLTAVRTERWPEAEAAFGAEVDRSEDADPFWITPVNEARLESLARRAYASHRWTDDLRGSAGVNTDRGAVFVRYGPPDRAVTLGPGEAEVGPVRLLNIHDDPEPHPDAADRLDRARTRLLWVYERSRRRYIFGLTPGYARAVFGGDASAAFARDRRAAPAGFDNLPLIAGLDSIDVLAFQFRGATARHTELALFGVGPRWLAAAGDSAGELAGWIVTEAGAQRLAEPRPVEGAGGLYGWRVETEPGERAVRLEARTVDPAHAARGTSVVAARETADGGVGLSDLVVASRLVAPDEPPRWHAVDWAPVVGPVLAGDPVSLLWEVYDPTATAGVASYAVRVRVTAVAPARRGIAARVVGGVADALGLSAVGDDALEFQYEREVPARPVSVEYLTLDLADVPPGRYLVTVTIRDTHTGRQASAERGFDLRDRRDP
jgi:tetratricopeptide (TPR) repeat protein